MKNIYPVTAEADLPQGVQCLSLAAALQDKQWQSCIPQQWDASDAKLVYIAKNTVIEKPLYFPARSDLSKKLIVIDEGSQASVLEEYHQDFDVKVETQIVVRAQSQLSYYKLQHQALGSNHIASTHITQSRDSVINCYNIALGASLAEDRLSVKLAETGCEIYLYGLYLPFSGQKIAHHLQVEHCVANGFSQQLYKGIVDGGGEGIFNGRIKVAQDAQKTCAYQHNQNLLLADNAKIGTKPELEIYADDVKCSHGATVGQIDQQALFYLRSRGIEETMARIVLIKAFADEIFAYINQAEIGEYIREQVFNSLSF